MSGRKKVFQGGRSGPSIMSVLLLGGVMRSENGPLGELGAGHW